MLIIAGAIAAGVVILVLLMLSMWQVAEPNEALLVSGFGASDEVENGLGFKIVSGKGVFVIPVFQRVRRFTLDLQKCDLAIQCLSSQRVPMEVEAVAVFKVGDAKSEIANAARRFLDKQNDMVPSVQELLGGHLRSIIGSMTVEDIIHDRAKLTEQVRQSCGGDMEKLGLIIDSMQIKHINDTEGYIQNLSKIKAAEVARDARVAQANAEREATQAEQEANALKAEAVRETNIKQAAYQAEVDQARATSQQAGPLADAQARQEVVVQQTKIAELEAARKEKELNASIRVQADADAYQRVTLAEADRKSTIAKAEADAQRIRLSAEADAHQTKVIGEAEAAATKLRGEAEGAAIEAKGTAEAVAIGKRGEALEKGSDAIVRQQMAENMPAIVRAAAEPLGHAKDLTILNGGDGMMDIIATTATRAIKTAQTLSDALRGADETVKNDLATKRVRKLPAVQTPEEADPTV